MPISLLRQATIILKFMSLHVIQICTMPLTLIDHSFHYIPTIRRSNVHVGASRHHQSLFDQRSNLLSDLELTFFW